MVAANKINVFYFIFCSGRTDGLNAKRTAPFADDLRLENIKFSPIFSPSSLGRARFLTNLTV